MDIEYFNLVKYSKVLGRYALETPSHTYNFGSLEEYIVQENEDMRFDLIMTSIYEDKMYYQYLDVILYLNNIDNPLNIRYGQNRRGKRGLRPCKLLHLKEVRKVWNQIKKEAGVEDRDLKSLRHTFAVFCVSQNVSLRVLQKYLGHKG
jgi:hypothetical protein